MIVLSLRFVEIYNPFKYLESKSWRNGKWLR